MFYDKIAKKQLGRSPKHVLLLHENDMAALYLGELIQHTRGKGWEIISPQEAYQDSLAKRYNPKTFTFNKQGRVAALAHSNGAAKNLLRHKNENAEYLKMRIKELKIFKVK